MSHTEKPLLIACGRAQSNMRFKNLFCPHCQAELKPRFFDLMPEPRRGTRWHCPHFGGELLTPSLFVGFFVITGIFIAWVAYTTLKLLIEPFFYPMPFWLWLLPASCFLFIPPAVSILCNVWLFKFLIKAERNTSRNNK